MTAHLLIDAGNTRIKWLLSGAARQVTGFAPTKDAAIAPAALSVLAKICAPAADTAADLVVTASNVAGDIIGARLRAACAPRPVHFISSTAAACGVTNRYLNASQLGTDRFAALIAAHHTHQHKAKLVVMAGTALTIDALSADGVFLGGVIVPAPALMQAALHLATAQLPQTAATAAFDEFCPAAFPLDTRSAILRGTLDAAVGAILQGIHRLQQHGHADIAIIASGGAMQPIQSALAPHLSLPLTIIDDLVLQGLHLLATDGAFAPIATEPNY